MSRNRKEAPLIPPPFSFAALYCDQIINSEVNSLSPEVVADHIKAIVQTTDQNVAVYVLEQLLQRIESSNGNTAKNIISLTNAFIDCTKSLHWFRVIVVKTFNSLNAFPANALSCLNPISALHVVVHSCDSKFQKESRKFLVNNVLNNISINDQSKIDSNTLFDLCELNIEGFDACKVFNAPEDVAFSVHIPKSDLEFSNRKAETVEPLHAIPIQSVLAESNATLISSRERLCELFSFYPDFSEKQAAAFIVALVLPQFHFMEYIEKRDENEREKLFAMHKSILEEKGLTVQHIIEQFEFLDMQPLPRDSCNILFAFLACMSNNKPIDVMPFVKRWRNAKFQNSILLHFSMNNVPCIDFSRSKTQANVDSFLPSPNAFSECCNCWKSMDFIQCVIDLLGNDVASLEKFFEPLIVKYPSVLLAIFARTDVESTENIIKISTNALGKLLQNQAAKKTVNNLWKNSSHFITQLLLYLYKEQPLIIDKIYETFSDHINELVETEDIMFATDAAIIAAANNVLSIGKFVENYVKKHRAESLLHITHFITQKASTMNSPQISVANEFFAYVSDRCNKCTIQQQFFISRAAKVAMEEQPALAISEIEVKVPQRLLQDAKDRASNLFNQLISGKEKPSAFSQKLSVFKFSDPILFEEIVSMINNQFNDIESLKTSEIKELAEVAGNLVAGHDLSKKQTYKILGVIKQSLNNDQQTPLYQFGEIALKVIVPDISNYPQFIYDVMRETRIRDFSPELFDKIQKIGQKINEPYHSSLPKNITIHPKLLRFNNLRKPSPKFARELIAMQADPSKLIEVLESVQQTSNPAVGYDWVALTIVDAIQDNPAIHPAFINSLYRLGDFMSIVFQAAAFRSLQHILSPEFDKYEGCLRRRRLIILGRLIGAITLSITRAIPARFLNLKKLLLYGISQGKLYGIVPFVVTIMTSASDFFKPPNPFSSGILYIMAGINAMDSIKMYIKQQILGLFNHCGITPAMFDNVPKYFPTVVEGNYDFLITPFSLKHFLSGPEIEKITSFDDTILNQFIQQYIVIPENPRASQEIKEKMKVAVAKNAINTIINDGISLAKTASSTALVLVKKDFKNANQPEIMIEPAYEMTKQLAASLVLFTAPMKLSRSLLSTLHQASGGFDPDWVDEIATKNYNCISQLLRDVVEIRAWNIVKEGLKTVAEDEKSRKSRNISILPPGLNNNSSCIQAQKVYAEYLELSLSQQQFPVAEVTQIKEKSIHTDPEFDKYLSSFTHYVPFDQSYSESQTDEEEVNALIEKCPNFSIIPVTFERFRSIIKTILKYASQCSSRPFENVLCRVLEKIVTSAPIHLITLIKPYVLSWVHSLLPAYVVCELVRFRLVDQKDLDKEFTALINSEPFNTKVVLHIMQTLFYGMVETSNLNPREMMSSLTAVCTINASQFDVSKEPLTAHYAQYIKTLTNIFETTYAPESGIPMNTKLQKFCVYDSVEVLSTGKVLNAVQRWKAAYNQNEPTELVEETREVVGHGATAMAALFSESADACKVFMQEFAKLPSALLSVCDVLEAVTQNLNGYANVIGADTSKFYYIARSAIELLGKNKSDNVDRYTQVVKCLHSIRPTVIPSFAFAWMQLISDKMLVIPLLSKESYYVSFFVLLSDFVAAVVNIQDESSDAFETSYRALLRLILILLHDYTDFMASCAPLLIQLLPFRFTQLRNLLLSLEAKANTPFDRAALNPRVSDEFVNLVSQLISSPQAKTNVATIISTISKDGKENMSYIFYMVQSILRNTKADTTEQPAYQALIAILEKCHSKLALCISNAIVDYISSNSLRPEATRIADLLIRSDVPTLQKFTVSEMIMRAIVERITASSKAPKPLNAFFISVIAENEKTSFLNGKAYIANNPGMSEFLSNKKAELVARQTK